MKVDELEALDSLLAHPGYPVLLKLMMACAENMERDLLGFTTTSEANCERELFIRKSRSEGARQLISAFKTRVEKQRPKG
jgi:hypothetical protein